MKARGLNGQYIVPSLLLALVLIGPNAFALACKFKDPQFLSYERLSNNKSPQSFCILCLLVNFNNVDFQDILVSFDKNL